MVVEKRERVRDRLSLPPRVALDRLLFLLLGCPREPYLILLPTPPPPPVSHPRWPVLRTGDGCWTPLALSPAFSTRAILRTYTVKLMATVATVPPAAPVTAAPPPPPPPLAEKPVCSEFTLTDALRGPSCVCARVCTYVYTDTVKFQRRGGEGEGGEVPREISRSLPIVRFIARSDIYILLKNFKFTRHADVPAAAGIPPATFHRNVVVRFLRRRWKFSVHTSGWLINAHAINLTRF